MAEIGVTTEGLPSTSGVAGPPAEWARPKAACRMFGFQQSLLYDLRRRNLIEMKKISSRAVLVNLDSVRRYIASLPSA